MIDVVRVIVDELGAEELAGFRSDCHRSTSRKQIKLVCEVVLVRRMFRGGGSDHVLGLPSLAPEMTREGCGGVQGRDC